MATTADIRNGLCIVHNNDLFIITEFLHVKPGKGPAFVRTKLRNVKTGRVIDNTFSAGHKITTVRVERRPYQFLYREGEGFNFMHNETFEQVYVPEHMVERSEFMKEGQIVEMMVNAENEEVLTCELPSHVELAITYSEPGVKGDTATNATKKATLETGAEIQVPLFINEGDVIKIDTEKRSYVERVRK
ncbi:elongation factor P [Hugenholtzia roseola]|uniref:elongation factor P n=1 Tax=Hugenholtzia roseola TaxID=1002 RepID=UPI00047B5240|nr:elongation factor P [Hugenholtzia roseola]